MDAITTPPLQGMPADLWQQLADHISQLVWISDGAGMPFWFNRRTIDYTGSPLKDLVGLGWLQVIHPDDRERVRQALQSAVENASTYESVFQLRSAEGNYRSFSSRAEPMRGEAGAVVGAALLAEEVADSRAAELALARSEERLRLATSGADVGIWEYDFTTGEGNWSDDAQRLIGANRSTFTLEDWSDFIHPDDRAEAISRWLKAVEDGSPYEAEVRVLDPGSPDRMRWVVSRGSVVFDAEHSPLAGRGVIFDVTERRTADHNRREAEGRYRTVFNSAAVGISRVGADGSFLEANDRFCEIVGWSREELSAGGWEEITYPDDVGPDLALIRRVLDGEIDSYSLEKRYVRKSGELVWVNLSVSAERDLSGEVRFFISVVEDISERKAAEAALQDSEARIRIATEHAEVGFWDVDEINKVLTWPPLVKAMFGISPDVPVSMEDFYNGLHPEDRERTAAAYAASADPSRRALYDVEYRTVGREDGVIRWVAAKGRGLFTEDGRCERVLGTAIDITARKRAEQALRESEERYRTLFESMEQGFCVLEVSLDEQGQSATDYRFIELNPAFTKESGLSPDVLGKPVSEAVPNLERAWFDDYAQVAITGESLRFVREAAELQRTFEVYAFRIGDPARHHVAILFSDVTDRIRQENALRSSEQELRLRLNAIPQMVWSTLPDGYHDFYNDRWYEFTGTPHGSTDGAGWNGMFHPDDQDRAWERWRQSLVSGEPYEIEYRLRHHSGDYRWVLGRALPIRNEAGEIVRWMGTCTDVHDRIEVREALQSSEARLRAIIEAAPIGLVFADASGQITGGNSRVEELVGHKVLPSADYDHYDEWVSFHADGRRVESTDYPLAKVLANNIDRSELEVEYQRGDGRRSWIRFVASAVRTDDGALAGGVVASLDIDREKRLTESLEREVEKVIGEREAAQEALRQSQKLEAMGQLTGGVAHDFNNLLTPIIGSLDLLQRKQILDERTGRLIDGALASAEKARILVQRLLAFARRQPLKRQAVDIGRIVAEMSELIDSTSGPKVRVEVAVPDQRPAALADSNQLEMALLNLSVNARDAMPDGGTLTIAVRTEQVRAGNKLGLRPAPHLVLSVSDTGQGMDEVTRRRAIEPFFSTKGVGKGTGLGLSMVHGLAAQLGGALDIRSAVGVGTTIELWLPVANGDAGPEKTSNADAGANGAGVALLVDDEELVRASTAGMLADLGYSVVEADSGEAALKRVEAGLKPDLLITDQLMPGVSGTDLAVQLREQLQDVPILIVSGYADLDSLSPAFPHLSKPFRQAELAAALEKLKAGADQGR